MGKTNINKKTSFVALLGVLGAEALALSFLENFIPAIPGLPPGAKPGFANIVTMFTASTMGFLPALAITVIKSVFAFITRGATAGMMSFAGGLLSTIVMVLLLRLKKNPFGILGVSVASATAHNAGQLAVACIISGTPALILGYGPLLLLFAVITGSVTGVVLKIVLPALEKQSSKLTKG
ncbi:MAG: Gx transporter family protein [Clostridia bacterium]|nr:Gx transporter family protein [Clostridia bacterium]